MSGIAEILLSLGFKVSGSDISNSAVCKRLESLGAAVSIGQRASNIPEDVSLLVYSSAVRQDNPELQEARNREIPVVRRAEVLAELMRLKFGVGVAGSHGKTTTTSMIAAVLEAGGLDPTVIIGGQLHSLGSGGRLGRGDYLVAETDESDKSFLLLKPTLAVVTNIDSEHLSAYSSFSELEDSFEQFVNSVPFYGLSVLCVDDPRVRALSERYRRRKLTYGISPDAQLRGTAFVSRIESATGKFSTRFDVSKDGTFLASMELSMLGLHIAVNSLAAIGIGLEFGIPIDVIKAALKNFSGVKRRLEVLGKVKGVTVVSDYGHHPTEIKATIHAIRSGWCEELKTLRVVFQPHRFTRTRECFDEFLDAFGECDSLVITDIYSAGEDALEGVTSQSLLAAMRHPDGRIIAPVEEALSTVLKESVEGDVVLFLGAGSIGTFAERAFDNFSKSA